MNELGPKKPVEFLLENDSENPDLTGFGTESDHSFYKKHGIDKAALYGWKSIDNLTMKQQQQQHGSGIKVENSTGQQQVIQPFREIVPDFNEIALNVAKPKKGLTIDLTSKIASKYIGKHWTLLCLPFNLLRRKLPIF